MLFEDEAFVLSIHFQLEMGRAPGFGPKARAQLKTHSKESKRMMNPKLKLQLRKASSIGPIVESPVFLKTRCF